MNTIGYVVYPDGGCRPNPNGFGGSGIHAYRWSTAGGTRGIGHTTHAATVHGYEPKAKSTEFVSKNAPAETLLDKEKMDRWLLDNQTAKVAVDCYFDMSIPVALGATNNQTELQAAVESLEYLKGDAILNEASMVQMRCDSLYVITGFSQQLPNWIGNGFVKRDGSAVANSDMWRRLWDVYQDYEKANIKIKFEHVKGHGDCPGNNNADYLATTGVMASKSYRMEPFYKESEVQGYWKSGGDQKHPFFSMRFAYFSTEKGKAVPGEYYTGNQGKVVELIGKKVSGSMFGLIKLKEPDELIESIIEHQIKIPSDIDYLALMDVDAVYGQQWRYLNMIGPSYAYMPQLHRKDLMLPNETYITKELNPAYLAARTVEEMEKLEDILIQFKNNDDFLAINDVTDTFYDITEEKVRTKKGEPEQTKSVCTLKPSIIVGYSVHALNVKYHTIDRELKEIDLNITLGIDIPERNCLKRIEATHPKVSLITWNVGHGVFLYATVIESDGDIGIWSGAYSNMRLTPEAATALVAKNMADKKKKE